MGTEPQRLERDIMRQRIQLGDDVDALVEKVSPGQAARRQAGRLGQAASTVKERVMGQASELTDTAKAKTAQLSHNAHDHAAGAGSGLAERATDLKQSTADTVSSSADAARRHTEGNPLAAGLIAFGVGWLASSLVPASQPEQRAGAALRERGEEPVRAAAQQLGDKAKEIGEHLREPAEEALGALKQTATDAVQEVKDRAGDHADHLTGEAKDRAQTVQGAAAG